jgi:hypothetical protein
MPSVFLSSQAIDRRPARTLAAALVVSGIRVESSPRNPLDGEDSRWTDWYSTGLPQAIRGVDVAVLVLDEGWDSATWMAEEARLAFVLLGDDAVLYWNPNNVSVRAAGMLPYLKTRLPDAISDAIACLRGLIKS